MPKKPARPGRDEKAPPQRRGGWFKVALLLGGCCLAGWLGGKAGRYFQLAADDFRPAPPPHMYVSGPTHLDAGGPPSAVGEHGA